MTIKRLFLSAIRRLLAARCRESGALLLGLTMTSIALADIPSPFNAGYEARYGGFRASAERSLQIDANGDIEMTTDLALKLFGKTVSGIHEQSVLELKADETFRPLEYSFVQTGLGKRKRQIHFDWRNNVANATVNNNSVQVPLQDGTMDSLSAYLEIARQLRQGRQDIVFAGIEKGEMEELHFRVLAQENLGTAIGELRTVKLEKVRGENSDRHTEIWLALDWDYLLVKLVQEEPGSSKIRLDLKQATVGSEAVQGIARDTDTNVD